MKYGGIIGGIKRVGIAIPHLALLVFWYESKDRPESIRDKIKAL